MAHAPFLTVVRGNPTPEEIAALVAAVLSRDSTTTMARRPAPPARRPPWTGRIHDRHWPPASGTGTWHRWAAPPGP
jgi:hypothetical protein